MNGHSRYFTIPSTPGIRLHALHWDAPAQTIVVLLHGGGANAHWWDHIAPSLARRFTVVALDFRGHGDSDHPEAVAVGAFHDDLEALLEHLGTERVVLVGHSMGAHVALGHAACHPETLALALIDAARGGGRRARRAARLALLSRRTYSAREEAIARYRFYPPAPRADDSLRDSIARSSVREEPDGRFGFKFDPRWFGIPSRPAPDLAEVHCPTLLIRGAESDLLTQEAAAELVAELPDGHLVEIESAGHQVQLDQPASVIAALEAFLDERVEQA